MTPDIPYLDEAPGVRARLARAKVLYTDLDGTLLGRGACLLADGEGRPTIDAATAVTELNALGLTVVIASGRNGKQLMEVTRMLGWADFIGEMGTVRSYARATRKVYDTGEWPPDATREGETPYEAIVRVGALEALQAGFPRMIEYHDPWHLDREVTHVLRGNVPLGPAQEVLDALPLAIDLIDNGIIHPPAHGLVCGEVHAYHLVPRGVSKARGISADLAERRLAPEEALAIGDSAADVAMARSVGLMAVVANGLDDARLVERASAEDGVVATRGTFGTGWRELAEAWMAAARG